MKFFATALALAAAGNAHMIMKTPTPFNTPNSSPLASDGSDYPCKGQPADGAVVNEMSIGSSNTLSFTGSAVHGGGSCQVSIASLDGGLTKDTKFLVIKSIEGGCPADTTSSGGGNLPADPNGNGAATFQFTIPDHPDIPTGKAVMAWTWQNRIGNREMYMNCALVNINGAAKKRYAPTSFSKRQDAPLPEIFKANIGNGCTTVDSMDVQYPDPGSVLEKGANAKLAAPVGNCGSSGSGSDPVATTANGGSASTTAAPTSVATSVASGNISQTAGGGFATVSASAVTSATTSAAGQASSVVASTATSASAPVGTGTSGSGATGSCTTGDWNCASDGKSFQRCIAGGTWSASIPMSEGMSCTPGISANFAYAASGNNGKRDLRSHIARRRHALHGAVIS